jgi:hypothetical protein
MGEAHNTLKELALYAMQGLPVEVSAAVSTHLQNCSACRTDHAQVGVDLALMGLVVQQRALPLGARERFMGKVDGSALMKPQDAPANTTTIPVSSARREPGSARIFEIPVERTGCDLVPNELQPQRKAAPGTNSAIEKKSLLSMKAPASMATRNKPNAKSQITTAMPALSRVAAARIVNIF